MINVGDKAFIVHQTGSVFSIPIVIPVIVVKVGEGKNDGLVRVDSENQKGVLVRVKDLSFDPKWSNMQK